MISHLDLSMKVPLKEKLCLSLLRISRMLSMSKKQFIKCLPQNNPHPHQMLRLKTITWQIWGKTPTSEQHPSTSDPIAQQKESLDSEKADVPPPPPPFLKYLPPINKEVPPPYFNTEVTPPIVKEGPPPMVPPNENFMCMSLK